MNVTQDLDIITLVLHASIVVKVVMLLLLLVSFMERARSELLNAAGIDLARFTREHGVLFVVFQIAVTYHQPARLHDRLSVTAEVAKMGRASVVFRQRVERGADRLVEADVTLALVDRDSMRPARFPAALAQEFERALK